MKKPVAKKNMGGFVQQFSPLAMLIKAARRDKKDKSEPKEGPSGPSQPSGVGGMKAGGKVGYMKAGGKVTRGDGACMKGHTKGTMR
mgnify:CR=1 FL=1